MNAFDYRPGASLLHRLDPRTKLAAVALIGLVGLAAPPAVPAAAGIFLVGLLRQAGIAPRQWIRDFKTFWVLLLFVLAARALTVPGTSLARFGPVDITQEGLVKGAEICLRLWLVALAGVGVPTTTSPVQIEAAVRWLLRPLPFVPEKRVATMLGLVVRFLPEVLRQASRTRQAQSARCIEMRKNPVRRLSLFAFALLRAVFIRAELLALAMEARCYSDNRTVPKLTAGPVDAAAGGVLACLVVFSLL